MKNHYIVCGYGEIGSAICAELKEQQIPVVVITNDERCIAAVTRDGYAVVQGNPTADVSLKEAGIDRAYGVIAIIPDDADNLFIALAAQELNPKILIIARGEEASVEDRILRAGADIVVSPMKLGGRQIAELIKQQTEDAKLVGTANLRHHVMGLRLVVHRNTSEQPQTVADVLAQTDVVGIAALKRADGTFEYSPSDAVAAPGDDWILISRLETAGETFQKQPTGKTILLADDHRELRLLFSRKLASAGHNVIQAATGDEALALASSTTPDLAVLDVNMPGRDGYEVCKALRASPHFAHKPIILYSGQQTEEFLIRGRSAGADVCIRKSSKSGELLEQIDQIFATGKQNPVDQQPIETAPFDLKLALENLQGDQKLLDEVIRVVLDEIPLLMSRIQIAIDESNPKEWKLAAHTLQGSLNVIAAEEAQNAAIQIENSDPTVSGDQLNMMYQDLRTKMDTVTRVLRLHCDAPLPVD